MFTSVEDAHRFFRERVPRILDLASEEAIAAFAQRTCYHIGQKLTCSQLYGGKVVLIGDAAAPFPPIGQGVNAAMESAMVLDLCIGEVGHSPMAHLEAANLYNRIRNVTSVTVDLNVTERLEFTPSNNAGRYIIEVSPPDGTSSARVKGTQQAALVFPEERIGDDTRYVLDVL